MLTVEDAKKWALERLIELDKDRLECENKAVQMLNRIIPEKSKNLWDSGCWLESVLLENGASKEQVKDIQFAHGQRSFANDEWKVAVDYANEFIANGETQEKGGFELARKINEEIFEK
jgi:hypothetical protein